MDKAETKAATDDLIKTYQWVIVDAKGETRETAAYQKQLGLDQEIALAQVLRKLEIEDVSDLEQLTIAQIIDLLAEREIVQEFFGIILILGEETSKEDLLELPYPVQKRVMKDFFSFNAELIGDLKNFVNIRNISPAPPGEAQPSRPKKSSTSAPPAA